MTTKQLYVPAAALRLRVPDAIREPAHYLLHAIFCAHAIRRADSPWVPLNAAILQSVHRRYAAARRWAIEVGIVECNGSYRAGVTSMGYRWGVPYETAKRHPATPALTRTLARLQRRREAALSDGARHLIARLQDIHIDAAAARRELARLEPNHGSPWSVEAYRSFLSTSIRLLEDRELYSTVDDFGRLHTPLTSLHRALRKFLYVKGPSGPQPLTNLDIRNSQPLTLALLLTAPEIPTGTETTGTNNLEGAAGKEPLHRNSSTEGDPYARKKARSRSGAGGVDDDALDESRRRRYGHDVADYVETCERGRFYESLMRFFPAVRDAGAFMATDELEDLRGRFKRQVFGEVMFGPVKETALSRTFRDLWPGVWRRIVAEKGGPEGYPALARAMQRAESRLMIDRVGARLARELPRVPLASIHDSFLVPVEHAEGVRSIVLEEWSLAGLRPTMVARPA